MTKPNHLDVFRTSTIAPLLHQLPTAYTHYIQNTTMAPSRAVLRNATITFAALRTSSRTSTSPVTRQLHHLSIARPIANTRTTLSTLYTRRFNSSEAASAAAAPESAAVEAPDYLDEKELHIFQKLNAELEPTKLEVCFPCSPHLSFVFQSLGFFLCTCALLLISIFLFLVPNY